MPTPGLSYPPLGWSDFLPQTPTQEGTGLEAKEDVSFMLLDQPFLSLKGTSSWPFYRLSHGRSSLPAHRPTPPVFPTLSQAPRSLPPTRAHTQVSLLRTRSLWPCLIHGQGLKQGFWFYLLVPVDGMGSLEILENHLGNPEQKFLKHTERRLLQVATISTLYSGQCVTGILG